MTGHTFYPRPVTFNIIERLGKKLVPVKHLLPYWPLRVFFFFLLQLIQQKLQRVFLRVLHSVHTGDSFRIFKNQHVFNPFIWSVAMKTSVSAVNIP